MWPFFSSVANGVDGEMEHGVATTPVATISFSVITDMQ
jgi:hypothetical protein